MLQASALQAPVLIAEKHKLFFSFLQMLLRGVNAVGYTSYADNVVNAFVKEARVAGVDIFRVFDSLNYIDNLKFGIDSVHQGGGVAEGTLCYTGDVSNPSKKKVRAKPIRSSMHCVNMLLTVVVLAWHQYYFALCDLSHAWNLKKCRYAGVVSSLDKTLGSRGRKRLFVVSAM